MKWLFYAVARYGVMLRALRVLAVIAAIAIALAAPDTALAGRGGFDP